MPERPARLPLPGRDPRNLQAVLRCLDRQDNRRRRERIAARPVLRKLPLTEQLCTALDVSHPIVSGFLLFDRVSHHSVCDAITPSSSILPAKIKTSAKAIPTTTTRTVFQNAISLPPCSPQPTFRRAHVSYCFSSSATCSIVDSC